MSTGQRRVQSGGGSAPLKSTKKTSENILKYINKPDARAARPGTCPPHPPPPKIISKYNKYDAVILTSINVVQPHTDFLSLILDKFLAGKYCRVSFFPSALDIFRYFSEKTNIL